MQVKGIGENFIECNRITPPIVEIPIQAEGLALQSANEFCDQYIFDHRKETGRWGRITPDFVALEVDSEVHIDVVAGRVPVVSCFGNIDTGELRCKPRPQA